MSRKSNDRAIREALASLQLPRMPDDDKLPSIRILVVADIDLPSASALSEHTLQQKNESYDAPIIDLCIACGSFCRDEDLMPYLRGKQMRREQTRQRNSNADDIWGAMPFFRTREQTAALEGLMTAALSQLESIVCRVIYCPGSSDPLSALLPDRPRRLTPNSRNLHQQWLPLAPGLGCAALVYLDAAEPIVSNATQRRDLGSSNNDSYRFSEDVSEDLEEDIDEMAVWTEQLLQVQQTSRGYCSTLERLLRLAPPPQHPLPFSHTQAQSILVTHYIDCNPSAIPMPDTEYMPVNYSPSWALEKEDKPWPIEHATFLDSAAAQQLLCLEIASGSASRHRAELIRDGKKQVLLPGSLRERGEFCIIEVALEEVGDNAMEENAGHLRSSDRRFAWNVHKVDFHQLQRPARSI